MRNILLSLCLIMLFASGCTKPGLVGSFCGPLPERRTVSAIAADAAACLSALHPPRHTPQHALDEKSAWYLQLRLSDPNGGGKAIARSYTASGQPEAGQSQT